MTDPTDALLIPYAVRTVGTDQQPGAAPAPQLPQLERLLARLAPAQHWKGDAYTLNPPHERALATLLGWPADDGLVPMAARAAQLDGLNPRTGDAGWGLLTPVHWHVGAEHVTLTDPAELQLDAAASRALYDAVQPLFVDEGWALHWGAATRWYAVHPSLAQLPTASLDRVVGRNVDLWLGANPEARRIRRLQSEVQMLLHTHPVNAQREAAGLLPVNSFWLSGCGATPDFSALAASLQVDDRLRAPALAGDAAAWMDAWRALDAGPVRALTEAAQRGARVALTLCGEKSAQRYETDRQPRWRSWLRVKPRSRWADAWATL